MTFAICPQRFGRWSGFHRPLIAGIEFMKDTYLKLLAAAVFFIAVACICNSIAIRKVQDRLSIIEKATLQQQLQQSHQQQKLPK